MAAEIADSDYPVGYQGLRRKSITAGQMFHCSNVTSIVIDFEVTNSTDAQRVRDPIEFLCGFLAIAARDVLFV